MEFSSLRCKTYVFVFVCPSWTWSMRSCGLILSGPPSGGLPESGTVGELGINRPELGQTWGEIGTVYSSETERPPLSWFWFVLTAARREVPFASVILVLFLYSCLLHHVALPPSLHPSPFSIQSSFKQAEPPLLFHVYTQHRQTCTQLEKGRLQL